MRNNMIELAGNAHSLESREVAEMVGKKHAHLCRDILGYIEAISENPKLDSQNFFVERTYKTGGNNKTYKRYDITKQGCEMVANKLTGKKGILFTAEYVKRFNEMERQLKEQPKSQIDILVESAKALQRQERELASLRMDTDEIRKEQKIQSSRIDTLNGVCTEGTKRQKLVAMVQAYAAKNGLTYREGWHRFKAA